MGKVITIDGPAGSGKSTVARKLAKKLGFIYLDTGAMYRAIALVIKEKKIDINNKEKLRYICNSIHIKFQHNSDPPHVFLGNRDISEDIRTSEIDMLSSKISAIKEVREAMTKLQRDIAKKTDIVAEGRDMGTVVFPDAEIKFFLTAEFNIRVKRRFLERKKKDKAVSIQKIKEELMIRDIQDQSRVLAPLKPAKDAIIIDTTHINIEEVINKMFFYIENC